MKARKLQLRFETALHHGSGFGIAGLVDRAVLRDVGGMPYLAGSAIKGRLRHAALRLLLSNGAEACPYGDDPLCRAPCPLCVIFGSRLRQGTLTFSDAYPTLETRQILAALHQGGGILPRDSSIRAGTSLDRGLGTVRSQLLFSTETLPHFLVFEGAISGDLSDSKFEELLVNATHLLTHFGAGGARGLGRCLWNLGGGA